jgi:integrase
MADLRGRDSISARALEFLVLTAARTGAVIGATWDEIDLNAKVWTVPPSRAGTKIDGTKPRRVPLSERAVEILKQLPREKGNRHVFIGGRAGRGLSNMALAELLKGMAYPSTTPGELATVHGMRSTFKDWAAERTSYENVVSEAALWHVVADKVEAAYRRGDLFEKRRRLMAEWARHCATAKSAGKVVPINKAVPA